MDMGLLRAAVSHLREVGFALAEGAIENGWLALFSASLALFSLL
jgi:hypothetical protein